PAVAACGALLPAGVDQLRCRPDYGVTAPLPLRPPLFPYTTLFRSIDLDLQRARLSVADGARRGHVRALVRHGRRGGPDGVARGQDRKSTRLNSSHVKISYAVFCLKKKNADPAAAPRRGRVRPSPLT